jgi:cellulase (glycosyl hydrolase family 5)
VVLVALACALATGLAPGTGALAGAPGSTATRDATASSCPTREVHIISGWVHTCGTEIVDSRGHLVRPLSVSMFTMSHDQGRDPSRCRAPEAPPPDSYPNLRSWRFNSVLLYISWANVEPTKPTTVNGVLRHHYSAKYLNALADVVRKFASHRVKVILAMGNNRWSSAFTDLKLPNGITVPCGSGMPAWLYPNGGGLRDMVIAEERFFSSDKYQGWFAKAWKKVAGRYRSNRGVIGAMVLHEAYDLLAQPYPGTAGLRPADLRLARFYERTGRAIRRADRHLLILTPDQKDWETGRFALTRKPKVANAVYDFEFFAPNWRTSGRPRMVAYWNRARAWHRPAWAEEFYAFLPTSGGNPAPTWDENTRKFLGYARDRHIGWSYAPYDRLPNDPPTLLRVLQSGWS